MLTRLAVALSAVATSLVLAGPAEAASCPRGTVLVEHHHYRWQASLVPLRYEHHRHCVPLSRGHRVP